MKPHIGISIKHLKNTSEILSHVLANEMTLYVKTRKAHWNASGESFIELHRLYEEHYKQLEESIDMVAERIGKMGHNTIGTMLEFTKLSTIKESPGKYNSTKETLRELLKDHETLIIQLRGNVEECTVKNRDSGSADFLTGLMEEHETISWILRRYLD
jgi:starvation-inducible DNA-binding protein